MCSGEVRSGRGAGRYRALAGKASSVSRDTRQKGEYAISVALAGAVLIAIVLAQSNWQPDRLTDVTSSAEEFIYRTTGLGGKLPEITGFERLRTFHLGRYRAGLYRASPAPLVFAPGLFVLYNRESQPVLKLETLEGSKEPWTRLYDFSGRLGVQPPGRPARPVYTRTLTGAGQPDIIVGQFSGGERCCTVATVFELGKESVKTVGRIEGLDGLPFERLELRKLGKNPAWELIAHRAYLTLCGSPADAADVISVYAYAGGQYTDQTSRYADFLASVLEQNLARWSRGKGRTIPLLQTLAVQYAMLGKRAEGQRFFAMNLPPLLPELQKAGVDPNACLEDMAALLNRLSNEPH